MYLQFRFLSQNLQDCFYMKFVLVEFEVQSKDMNIEILINLIQKLNHCCNFFLFVHKHFLQDFGFLLKSEYFVVLQLANKNL